MFLMFYLLPYYEHTFGWFRTFIALVTTGITSNIFSDIISPDSDQSMLKIGSSNFIYGIVGLGFGYIALNWSSLQIIGPIFKFKLCVTLIFSILFLIVFCDQVKVPDYTGHLGGFLAGFFFSGFMSTIEQTTEKTIVRGILVSLFLIMCVGSFLFFYLLPQAAYSV
jgi:membrane associated rhomboid family serine protease